MELAGYRNCCTPPLRPRGTVLYSNDEFELATILMLLSLTLLTAKTASELGKRETLAICLGSILCVVSLYWVQHRIDVVEANRPTPVAAPSIAWASPTPIEYGVPLSDKQLNATASVNGISVKGRFVYNPTYGETLQSGTHTLSVTFYPYELGKYSTQTQTVALTVKPPKGGHSVTSQPDSAGPRLGDGPDAYASISRAQLGQWIMEEADKVNQMAIAASIAISNDRQRGGDGGYPINRFSRDFAECCEQEIKDLHTEALRRLGPPGHDTREEELWKALTAPNPLNPPSVRINTSLIQLYLPYFKRLGFTLKRSAVPRAPKVDLPFSVENLPATGSEPYRIRVSIDTKKQFDSGYVVVRFKKGLAMLETDPSRGLTAVSVGNSVENKELAAVLDNHTVVVYALKLGAIPFRPHDPIHVLASGVQAIRVLSVSWFDE